MDPVINEIKLDTQRFVQEQYNYCGPASSEMFLSLSKFSIKITQSAAFDAIQKLNEESDAFYSDPFGVSAYLDQSIPAQQLSKNLEVCAAETYQDAIAQMSFTISEMGLPCIILVLGGAHWVVLHGLRYSLNNDGTKNISAFIVQDPSANSPPDSYIFPQEFSTKFIANTFGTKWKGKFIVLSPTSDNKPLPAQSTALHAPGGGGDLEDFVKFSFIKNGFQNVDVLGTKGGGAPLISTISVQDLDGVSNYKLVPLDATQTGEFKDFVYVAIADSDDSLLEVATLDSILNVFSDDEMNQRLQSLFPNRQIQIGGYVWKRCFELRSRLSVARPFKLDGIDKFLLPNGQVVDQLTQFERGGC